MEQKMLDDLIAVDLHVHTPDSKCYSVDKSYDIETAYMELLKTYIDKDIKIIGITDHNSIGGYKKLMDIKRNCTNRINIWSELGNFEEVKLKIENEKEKLDLFNKVKILPGVEFEAYPGIHILLIFSPDIDIKLIEDFIIDNGYAKEVQGSEEVIEVSTISAIDIVKEAYQLGAITIAAHADSDKGALKTLPSGTSRAQFFKNDELMGIQVVNFSTIEYLKELYRNKEYKRTKQPAFLRFSDYHGGDMEIEDCITYMKLSELSFEGVKEAISNSIECIGFTKNPKNNEIIEELIEQEYTYLFAKLSEEHLENIKKTMCGILNDGQGTIIIGISENKSIVGVKKEKKDCDKIIKNLMECFEDTKAFFRYKVDYYEFGNHIVIVLKLNTISSFIFTLDFNAYIAIDKKICIAGPNELAKLGENKFKKSFQFINSINKKHIDNINRQLVRIKELEENINLYKMVRSNSLNVKDVFNFKIIDINVKEESNLFKFLLGESKGSTYFISGASAPHSSEFYLRATCPTTNENIEILADKTYIGECMIIVPGGLVYYVEGEYEYKFANSIPIIRMELKEEFRESYSLKSIVAWLKSPILLYLMELIYDSINLLNPEIFLNIPIIMNNEFKKDSRIEKIFNQIINYEKEALNYVITSYDGHNEKEIDKDLDEHNKKVSEEACKIENELKRFLFIKDEENKVLEKFISEKGWKHFLDKI